MLNEMLQANSTGLPQAILPTSELGKLLTLAFQKGASDVHLIVGSPPLLRINGELIRTTMPVLTPERSRDFVYSFLSAEQQSRFKKNLELDASVEVENVGRFRVNVHKQRGAIEAAFRTVHPKVQSLQELGLPPIVSDLCRRPNGLVLVTGRTGMGKTTTISSMIDQIIHERRCLVVTIEDPIEYLHRHARGYVKQREVHVDTHSFAAALMHVLRQNPDVIVIGEMRDLKSISTALTAAETGHLVLATLHTPSATQTVDRIIDVFPPEQQEQVRVQLADCLQGVICQELLPRADGTGRVLAVEVLIATPAVRNLIRTMRTDQVPTAIETGAEYGMVSMDRSIKSLYLDGIISYETALSRARDPGVLKSA